MVYIIVDDKQGIIRIIIINNRQQQQIAIAIYKMYTPTNSQTSTTSKVGNLHSILKQLDRKIGEINELKSIIGERMIEQELELEQSNRRERAANLNRDRDQYAGLRGQIGEMKRLYGGIGIYVEQELLSYGNKNNNSVMEIVNYYESQIKKSRNFYQAQIWDLRQQIKRQYKVIALMKQQVQDLMMLMKYKETQNSNQSQNGQKIEQYYNAQNQTGKIKLNGLQNRQYSSQLEVIQQQTQRTLQSSQRSQFNVNEHQDATKNFIKIEQKQQDQHNSIAKSSAQKLRISRDEYIKSEQKISKDSNQNNIDQQFNEDLTPKEPEYMIQMPSMQSQGEREIEKQNVPYPTPTKIKQFEQIQTKKQEYQSGQAEIMRDRSNFINARNQMKISKSNKLHTAPSDDRKIEHLQSIFFLDDEPDHHYNKTTKIKTIGQKVYEYKLPMLNQFEEQNLSVDDHKKLQDLKARNTNLDFQIENLNEVASQILNSQQKSSHRANFKQCGQNRPNKTTRHQTQQQMGMCLMNKFSKIIAIGQMPGSSSMPVPSSNPLQQLNLNNDFQRQENKNGEVKPKTKQFLQQFRRTFNKCIKSMQVSKKNSTKIANSSSSSKQQLRANNSGYFQNEGSYGAATGNMTFGKVNSSSSYSSASLRDIESANKEKQNVRRQRDKQKQQYQQFNCSLVSNGSKQGQTVKAVDNMLKQLENNNKFMIGNKKIELKFEGQKKNGVRCGNGILYYSNGLCYQGEFREGLRHGYGILKFNHIQIYNGDWNHDQIQGQGKIRNCAIINKRKTIYSSQSPLGKWISYSGQFKNSKFQGSGTLYLQGGEKFVGNFSNGCACGQGSIYKKNGEVEHGFWKNNIMLESKQKDYFC